MEWTPAIEPTQILIKDSVKWVYFLVSGLSILVQQVNDQIENLWYSHGISSKLENIIRSTSIFPTKARNYGKSVFMGPNYAFKINANWIRDPKISISRSKIKSGYACAHYLFGLVILIYGEKVRYIKVQDLPFSSEIYIFNESGTFRIEDEAGNTFDAYVTDDHYLHIGYIKIATHAFDELKPQIQIGKRTIKMIVQTDKYRRYDYMSWIKYCDDEQSRDLSDLNYLWTSQIEVFHFDQFAVLLRNSALLGVCHVGDQRVKLYEGRPRLIGNMHVLVDAMINIKGWREAHSFKHNSAYGFRAKSDYIMDKDRHCLYQIPEKTKEIYTVNDRILHISENGDISLLTPSYHDVMPINPPQDRRFYCLPRFSEVHHLKSSGIVLFVHDMWTASTRDAFKKVEFSPDRDFEIILDGQPHQFCPYDLVGPSSKIPVFTVDQYQRFGGEIAVDYTETEHNLITHANSYISNQIVFGARSPHSSKYFAVIECMEVGKYIRINDKHIMVVYVRSTVGNRTKPALRKSCDDDEDS